MLVIGFDPITSEVGQSLQFWGFVIAMGVGISLLSTWLSQRLLGDESETEMPEANDNGGGDRSLHESFEEPESVDSNQ